MKRVIIVGASYAGLNALKKLKKNKNIDILVFDKNAYHYAQVESYGLASSIYEQSDVTLSLEKYINKCDTNVKFFKEEILSFNNDTKKIYTKDNHEFFFDYLIIATGSLTNFPQQIKNLEQFSSGIKTLTKALTVKNKFEKILKNSKITFSSQQDQNIVIAGAGLAGVEIAAEMANLVNKYKKSSLNISIILIDGMKTLLPNMDKRLICASTKRLEHLGVKVFLGSFIKDVTKESIYLENGTSFYYKDFIFTGGIKAVNLSSNKSYKLNKLNQYITDDYLHLENENNIFVIGDAAQVIYNNEYIAPTAQLAIQSGEYVSTYIANEIQSKKQKKFTPSSKGVLISLGGTYAIGLLFNKIFIEGTLAYYLKKITTNIHKTKFA